MRKHLISGRRMIAILKEGRIRYSRIFISNFGSDFTNCCTMLIFWFISQKFYSIFAIVYLILCFANLDKIFMELYMHVRPR